MHLDEVDAYALTDSARIAKWNSTNEEWEYTYTGVPGDVIIEDVFAVEAVVLAAGQSGGDGKGVFRSRDGGSSWIKVPDLPDINFYSISVVSNVWFASGIDFNGPPLFYSTNQGANFDACVGLDAASQTGAMIEFDGKIFVSTTDGLYYSSDSGVNFTKATGNGLPQFEMLDYFFTSGNTLRAFYFSFLESKLLESTDNGENWTEVAMSGIDQDWVLKSCDELNGEFFAIAAKDAAAEFPRIYHSTDAGETWAKIGNDTPYPMLQTSEGFAVNSGMMIAGTTSGIFKSTDNGDTWTDASEGLRYNGYIQAQAFVQGNWVVSTATGLGKSTVYPSEWEEMNSPNPDRTISQLHTAGVNLYAYDYSNLYRTSDLGTNWENISSKLPNGFSLGNILGVDNKLYITGSSGGEQQLLISDDFGDNWTAKNAGSDYIAMLRGTPAKLVIAAGTNLLESTDEGDSWTAYQNNGLISSPNFYEFIPIGDRVVAWAGDFNDSKMYYTDDMGANWVNSEDAEVIGQVEQFLHIQESLIAASKFGFYISHDDGETWNQFYDGYGQRNATSILSSGKYLLAATRNDAAWYRPQVQVTSFREVKNSSPENFELSQNYPNPFNPSTKISFTINSSNHVKLTIYSITGEKIITLLDREINAGNYEVDFNAQNLTSGVYFYKIQAGNFVSVKKMILMK